MYICVYVYTCSSVCIFLYIHGSVHVYTYIHAYMYALLTYVTLDARPLVALAQRKTSSGATIFFTHMAGQGLTAKARHSCPWETPSMPPRTKSPRQ